MNKEILDEFVEEALKLCRKDRGLEKCQDCTFRSLCKFERMGENIKLIFEEMEDELNRLRYQNK